ncbi:MULTISPECIES: hypothetical protein [unclassified Polaribacter]|uniref:hypothetical protein n=1 Tax=unclassified Polaribacter TaxID=196858 RepID=UPI0011BF3BD4|nr:MULTISPECIES: hypothetical protein [unclassified Polaribacter]TXD53615.1 hypothetical protein ES043_03050 [Polaribacter sp. IC063]TXD62144.1 hypothetical protein ES044_02655 [Polaribacter sp. IC066]
MKNLFLTTVAALFLSSSTFGQGTPKTLKTPKTTSSSTTKSNSYSFSFDTDDKEENSSVSIKRNDNVYKFSAKFHESKFESLKKLVTDKLGDKNLTVSKDMHKWLKSENGEKVYECKLTEDRLRIYVDKEYASTNMITMMNDFGDVLKDAISGTDSKQQDKEEAERALKKAEKALKRAQRELEKVKNRADN